MMMMMMMMMFEVPSLCHATAVNFLVSLQGINWETSERE
jgi:hypothetical protein